MKSPRKAIVATGHPLVSEAAVEILEQDGNAYDAAIAAGFISAIAEPALTSLGGGGFLLARTNQGQEILFDFFSETPGKGLKKEKLEPHFFPVTVRFSGADQDFNIGLGSVAVPGNLKGFLHVHKRLGKLPLKDVVAPAVRAAREGIPIQDQQAHFLKLLYPIMTLTDQGKKIFEPQGNYISHGDIYRNPDLAEFLEHLPNDGGHSFYHGNFAKKIAQDMADGQGLLTVEDLHTYEVIEREPLKTRYRNYLLLTNPPPSFGGTLIATAFHLLGRLDLKDMDWGSPKHVVAHTEVMMTMERHRIEGSILDSQFIDAWQKKTSKRIKRFSRGTTHVSVVDKNGNVASMTTSNGEGAGYILPGTGIMFNNMMGEDDLHPGGFHASPPGRRVASMMSPSILLNDSNQVQLVLGSGGSKRIRTALTQVISHVVDFGLNVTDAVNAPRIHWDGEYIQLEPGFSENCLEAFKTLGPVNVWNERNVYFGGVHAVVPECAGAGDPRRGGDARLIEDD